MLIGILLDRLFETGDFFKYFSYLIGALVGLVVALTRKVKD